MPRETPPFNSALVELYRRAVGIAGDWYNFMEADGYDRPERRFIGFILFLLLLLFLVMFAVIPGATLAAVSVLLLVLAAFDLTRLLSYTVWAKKREAEGWRRYEKTFIYRTEEGEKAEKRRKANEIPYQSLWAAVVYFFARVVNGLVKEAIYDLQRGALGSFCVGLLVVSAISVFAVLVISMTSGFILIVPAAAITVLEGVQFLFTYIYNSTRK